VGRGTIGGGRMQARTAGGIQTAGVWRDGWARVDKNEGEGRGWVMTAGGG